MTKAKNIISGIFSEVFKTSRTVLFSSSLVLVLVSCQKNYTRVDLDDAKCEAGGGKIVNGIIGEVCAMPTSDAGKACNDISECEGLCMGDGKCSEWDNNFGCTDVLVEGEKVTICID